MYRFSASETFWKSFYALPAEQKESVRRAWSIFRENPFDPRLRTHRINRLSSLERTTVWSVEVEGDLRTIFIIRHDHEIHTLDVGKHAIYK